MCDLGNESLSVKLSFKNIAYIVNDSGKKIAVIFPQKDLAQEKAIAHLLAAAPEMLEALKELTAWDLESLPGEVSLGFSGIEKDIALAKAAIAKALGETK